MKTQLPTPADFDESLALEIEDAEEGGDEAPSQLGVIVATQMDSFRKTRHAEIPFLRLSQFKGVCQYVHALADAMFAVQGTSGLRSDVIAAAAVEGVAFYTARTQYNHWFEAKFFPGRVEARRTAAEKAKEERAEMRAIARAQAKAAKAAKASA